MIIETAGVPYNVSKQSVDAETVDITPRELVNRATMNNVNKHNILWKMKRPRGASSFSSNRVGTMR